MICTVHIVHISTNPIHMYVSVCILCIRIWINPFLYIHTDTYGYIQYRHIPAITGYIQGSHPGGGKRDRLLWNSRKKESSARRAGSARPPTLVYTLEQRDSFVFRFLLLAIACRAQNIQSATQVWAIAVISLIPPEILIVSRCFHLLSS